MDIYDFEEEKTRQFWRKKYEKAGWAFENRKEIIPNGPIIYICETKSGYLQIVHTDADRFNDLARKIKQGRYKWKQMLNGAGALLKTLSKKAEPIKLEQEKRDLLNFFITGYLVGTKTYKAASLPKDKIIAYIVVGISGKNTDYWLRPVSIIQYDTKLLTPSELLRGVKQVIDIDRKAHPEKFPGAQVLPFKVQDEIYYSKDPE